MITLTERAAEKVKQQIEKRGHGLGITLGVKITGCSGLTYVLEYIDKLDYTMAVVECHGVHIWIKTGDIPYVKGIAMDWVKQGLNEGFEFVNPNEKSRCGCGSSFKV